MKHLIADEFSRRPEVAAVIRLGFQPLTPAEADAAHHRIGNFVCVRPQDELARLRARLDSLPSGQRSDCLKYIAEFTVVKMRTT